MKSPVLLIVFNRLSTAMQVFGEIKKCEPEKLYIASDGARQDMSEEEIKVQEVRTYLMENISWKCDVKTLFNTKNRGCKYGPQEAITWFFENEASGIILEDDCLPSESFFPYCDEILEKYKDDLRVFGASGVNFSPQIEILDSYYFSSFFFTWGWATWRNRWYKHLEVLENFNEYINHPSFEDLIENKYVWANLRKRVMESYENRLDTWDYPWFVSCIINNALIVAPGKNLIKNIGFGEDATHTVGSYRNQREHEKIQLPLRHPIFFKINVTMDNWLFKNVYYWKSPIDKLRDIKYLKIYLSVLFKRLGLGK